MSSLVGGNGNCTKEGCDIHSPKAVLPEFLFYFTLVISPILILKGLILYWNYPFMFFFLYLNISFHHCMERLSFVFKFSSITYFNPHSNESIFNFNHRLYLSCLV